MAVYGQAERATTERVGPWDSFGSACDKSVSLEDVAKHPGIAKDFVYRWIEHLRLPAHKMGRLWKLKLPEVDEWVRAGGADTPEDEKEGGR